MLAFFIHNLRGKRSGDTASAGSAKDSRISPTALAGMLMEESDPQKLLLCRIQTPKPADLHRVRRMLEQHGNPDAVHYSVENGVVVSCYRRTAEQAESLGNETVSLLRENGFMEGSCLMWSPTMTSEALLTWILRGDNHQPTGPMRLNVDVSPESVA